MKIVSYILMTLSVLTFSLISMEDPGNDMPVTLSGNKRKRNGHERQSENLKAVFQELSDVLPLPEQKTFISGNFLSTIGDDAYHSPDHYQAPSSSTEPEETRAATLGLLASNALAQKPQKGIRRSSSRHLPKKLHHCDEPGCNKAFPSPSRLEKHKRIHTGEKPHICDYQGCNQAFTQKGSLNTHKNTVHTSKKPFKCDHVGCNKTFPLEWHLNRHKRTHTNERPHKCDWQDCNKAYTSLGALNRHIKESHTNEKLHQCDEPGCNKTFVSPYRLKEHKHQRIHTDEKPHKCDQQGCNKAYTRMGNLNKHKRLVHSLKPLLETVPSTKLEPFELVQENLPQTPNDESTHPQDHKSQTPSSSIAFE